jgi:CRP/FNR family cyclic AMP-dependent transcriptional regulator
LVGPHKTNLGNPRRTAMTFVSSLQALPKVHTWRGSLSPEATAELKRHLSERRLVAGEALYYFGEAADCGYQIVTGRIEINSFTSIGREYVAGSLGEGDTLGDLGLVNGGLRFNNAVALTETKVNVLKRSDYLTLIRKYPEVSQKMAEMLGYRYQSLFGMIQDAYLLPLYQRLGRIVVRMVLAQTGASPSGAITLEDCSQEKLGQMAGATRQSVGREMKKMESAGLIQIDYKRVTVLDFKAMVKSFGSVVEYEPLTSAQFPIAMS